ncbi:unnamed protein product [Nyctereutes procyonoides]|uniref:(raccoon dog) hypothetical protein n=1 Tax=Nyctereutes procyonoides TaxID=34880 RepID=A0A811XWR1_NYCPR|nr:unnamed protein product [Nyctereutes procyonoides]
MLTWLEIIYPRACFPAASTCLDVAEGGLHALPAVPTAGSVLSGLPDASGHLEGRVEGSLGAVVPGCPARPAWSPTQRSRTWLPSQGTGACLGRPVTLPKPLYLVQVLHRTLVLEEEVTEAQPEASWSPQQLVVAAATDPLQSEDLDPAAEAAAEATPARDLQAFPSVPVMLPPAAAPALVPASWGGLEPALHLPLQKRWSQLGTQQPSGSASPGATLTASSQCTVSARCPTQHSMECSSPLLWFLFAFVFLFVLSLFVFVFSHSFCCSLLWILNRFSYFQLSNS